MLISVWDLVKMSIEMRRSEQPGLVVNKKLARQIRVDCEKLDPLVEEGLVCGFSSTPCADSGDCEVRLFFSKGAEHSERYLVLLDILSHAVRIGVCTDEEDAEEGEEIHLGLRWDYPRLLREPEE